MTVPIYMRLYRESRSINRNVESFAASKHLRVGACLETIFPPRSTVLGRELSARCNSKTVREFEPFVRAFARPLAEQSKRRRARRRKGIVHPYVCRCRNRAATRATLRRFDNARGSWMRFIWNGVYQVGNVLFTFVLLNEISWLL